MKNMQNSPFAGLSKEINVEGGVVEWFDNIPEGTFDSELENVKSVAIARPEGQANITLFFEGGAILSLQLTKEGKFKGDRIPANSKLNELEILAEIDRVTRDNKTKSQPQSVTEEAA